MLAARGSDLRSTLLDCTEADVFTFVLAARGSGLGLLPLGGADELGVVICVS